MPIYRSRFVGLRTIAVQRLAPHLEHRRRSRTPARSASHPAIRAKVSGLASRKWPHCSHFKIKMYCPPWSESFVTTIGGRVGIMADNCTKTQYPGKLLFLVLLRGVALMPLKRVTVGKVVLEGDADKELFEKYLIGTVSSMADLDGVMLPYEFLEKLGHLIDAIPADEFDGCLDDAVAGI